MSYYGGESFLQVALPNYERERFWVTILLIGSSVFWIFIFDVLRATKVPADAKTITTPTVKTTTRSIKTVCRVQKSTPNTQTITTNPSKPQLQVSLTTTVQSVVGLLLSTLVILLVCSPHNYYTSRRVFQAPLLTRQECLHVIQMANAAAERNYQKALAEQQDPSTSEQALQPALQEQANRTRQGLLQEPHGWQKTRHESYPTTDLNLVTDPFTAQDRKWLAHLLNRRLAPTLARIFGIPVASIRANDLFVVRYDAGLRAHLANHTDSSDVSFNVLLNDEFQGGGTRFWNRHLQQPFALVQPRVGQVLMHSALIHHEGLPITLGTRLILVGFLSVDRINLDSQYTGLSFGASWASWPWLQTKFKQGYSLSEHRSWYMRNLLLDLMEVLQGMGDAFCTHAVEVLVDDDQNANAYRQALDQAYDSQEQQSVWYQGQQLKLDMDGSFAGEWTTRSSNTRAFEEL